MSTPDVFSESTITSSSSLVEIIASDQPAINPEMTEQSSGKGLSKAGNKGKGKRKASTTKGK